MNLRHFVLPRSNEALGKLSPTFLGFRWKLVTIYFLTGRHDIPLDIDAKKLFVYSFNVVMSKWNF